VLQAEAFARGHATLGNPVAALLPDAPNAVFAPTGFVPSPHAHGQAVPICAPGLALAMAAVYLIHPSAVFLVVPLCAAWLVWLTFVYGRRVDGDTTGACAAVLVACSPIFLYQAVQPMSDVPAAAAWMAALVAASPIAGGVWASIAILIRPNLALLVLVLIGFRLKAEATSEEKFRLKAETTADEKFRLKAEATPRESVVSAFRRNLPFLLAMLPGLAIFLALNAARYGSPFATGYGSADALFTRAHVYANLLRYPRWIFETHTPFVLLALAAPWLLRRDPARARLAWMSLAAAALLAATYLAYSVFDDWWYIRFLLPALPMTIALSVAVLRSLAARVPPSAGRIAFAAVVAAVSLYYVQVARARHATDLRALESRFALAGEYAGRALPPNAVVLAVQQSGSIRFHGGRDTIAWDAVPETDLDAYVERLRGAGRVPFIALEDEEEPRFRRRFDQQRAGSLDWRPMEELPAPVRVRFYDPAGAR
jgi:hypothetical protein